MEEKFLIYFNDMESSDALRKYALEKFGKHEYLLELVTSIEINMTQHTTHRGVSKDFELEVLAKVPKTIVKVNERGEDMYALIDVSSDKIARSLKRYYDKLKQWEGKEVWRVKETFSEDELNDAEMESFTEYVPTVTERKEIEYRSPMEEAEAIERMELSGRNFLLFKNNNGGISLVYRTSDGYGVEVVPEGI